MRGTLIAAAAVLALTLALALWLRADGAPDRESPAETAAPERPPAATPAPPVASTESGAPRVTATRPTPAASSDSREPGDTAARPVSRYQVGDVRVTSTTGRPPRTEEPAFKRPEPRHVAVEVAHQVTAAAEPAVKRCAAQAGERATPGSKLSVAFTIAIKDGAVSVTDTTSRLGQPKAAPDADPALADSIAACIQREVVGTSLAAAGEPDTPSYRISTSYNLP